MKKSEVLTSGIILLSFIVGIYFYSQLPQKLASHWNIRGEVDSYLPKFWGLFLMPVISTGVLLLFILIPNIDPSKENFEKFRKYYDRFVVLIITFFLYLYLLTIFWNLGVKFNIVQFLVPALAILFYYCGILLENVKKNWFVGIRTPWTMMSEKVWDKTHKLGGKLFKIVGIFTLLGILFPDYAIFFVFIPVIFLTAYTVIYSYFEYQKEVK